MTKFYQRFLPAASAFVLLGVGFMLGVGHERQRTCRQLVDAQNAAARSQAKFFDSQVKLAEWSMSRTVAGPEMYTPAEPETGEAK